jgi:hypothetical protein
MLQAIRSFHGGNDGMRNLLALFALAILIFAGVGWYLDWYKIKTEPAAAGHHHVNIDFNGTKIREDSKKGVLKVEENVQKILDQKLAPDKAHADEAPGANSAPSTVPRLSIEPDKEPPESAGPDLP